MCIGIGAPVPIETGMPEIVSEVVNRAERNDF
jgi:hypothetical protein